MGCVGMHSRDWSREGDFPKHHSGGNAHVTPADGRLPCEPPSFGWFMSEHLSVPSLALSPFVGLLSAPLLEMISAFESLYFCSLTGRGT